MTPGAEPRPESKNRVMGNQSRDQKAKRIAYLRRTAPRRLSADCPTGEPADGSTRPESPREAAGLPGYRPANGGGSGAPRVATRLSCDPSLRPDLRKTFRGGKTLDRRDGADCSGSRHLSMPY